MIDQRNLDRANELITMGEAVLATVQEERDPTRREILRVKGGSGHDYVDTGAWSEWRTRSLSFLQLAIGEMGPYRANFEEFTQTPQVGPVNRGIGVLRAVREDVAAGHLVRYKDLVHAEAFSEIQDQAEYLLSTGYKDAAAVMAGGVLEGHLRLLCERNGVPTRTGTKAKSNDGMNAELARAAVYDTNRLKIVTAWLGVRNSAAHGNYGDYTNDQVAQLLAGLREFISRYPA